MISSVLFLSRNKSYQAWEDELCGRAIKPNVGNSNWIVDGDIQTGADKTGCVRDWHRFEKVPDHAERQHFFAERQVIGCQKENQFAVAVYGPQNRGETN